MTNNKQKSVEQGAICYVQRIKKVQDYISNNVKPVIQWAWLLPRKQVYAQSQQYKHWKKVWNMFKVNNKDGRTKLSLLINRDNLLQ